MKTVQFKSFKGVHEDQSEWEYLGYDVDEINAHEGDTVKLSLAIDMGNFKDSYWDAEFEDGFFIEGISGIYFK